MSSGIRLATRQRMAFDLLLDRPLPDAVADLDASLRGALVGEREMQLYLVGRHDRGIVQARRALELADPRAESHPESQMRVHLVLDGLQPHLRDPRRLICTVRAALTGAQQRQASMSLD